MQAGVQSDDRSGTASPAEIDLGALGGALWRKRFLIAGLTLAAAAIGFAAVNLITPRYKSEARVLIETRENIFFRPDAEKASERGTTVDQEAVTSQVQLILSRDLAREVIKDLNLTESPEFNAALKEFSPLSILRTIGILKDPMAMTLEERRQVTGLHPDRAPAIVAGVILLLEAMRTFGLDEVEVSEHDILRGAALDRSAASA